MLKSAIYQHLGEKTPAPTHWHGRTSANRSPQRGIHPTGANKQYVFVMQFHSIITPDMLLVAVEAVLEHP